LRLWIGHYLGQPEEWFLVWAPNKDEAMVMVDDNVAEPDSRSMKELKEMGMIDLKAVKEEDDTEAFYSLHQIGDDEVDPRRQDEGMHYDNEVIFDDDVYEWIKKCVEKPLKVPKAEATSEAARIMRIRQPEVLMAHLKGSTGPCPSCGKEIAFGSKCESCGHMFKL